MSETFRPQFAWIGHDSLPLQRMSLTCPIGRVPITHDRQSLHSAPNSFNPIISPCTRLIHQRPIANRTSSPNRPFLLDFHFIRSFSPSISLCCCILLPLTVRQMPRGMEMLLALVGHNLRPRLTDVVYHSAI